MILERTDLCDSSQIEEIEAKLIQVFYRHVRREHSSKSFRLFFFDNHLFFLDENNIFLDILQLIPSIQEISKLHLSAIQYIKRYERRIFNSLPDFHRELYTDLWL